MTPGPRLRTEHVSSGLRDPRQGLSGPYVYLLRFSFIQESEGMCSVLSPGFLSLANARLELTLEGPV